MQPHTPFKYRPGNWHPLALLLGCGLSIAWFASWLFEPGRSLWLALDDGVFRTLNDSLRCCGFWQVFWAIANNRLTDVVAALAMIGLYLHFMWRQDRQGRQRMLSVGILLTLLVLVSVQFGKVLPIERPSPTLVHPDALMLTQLVDWIPTKDSSGDSFPGDHATVLLICAGVITLYLPRAYAIAAWLLAGLFMLPRLVSGAHWFTDDFVGSLAIAGFFLTVVFATPLHRVLTDRLEQVIMRLRRRGPQTREHP